jgi:hydrophobic/amphiphilic exporter-1 (mainly G- bacteria), HAE1 family
MFLPELCIRRPVTATVMVSILVIFGIIGLDRLGVMLLPDVDLPVASVSTIWRNARPEEVDRSVTNELEDGLGSIEGIKHINSESYQGLSRIVVEFELYKDIDVAAQDVRDKVSTRLASLPEDAEFPIIEKLDVNAQPVMWGALCGQRAIEELTDYADKVIKPRLQKLEGVGDVSIHGQNREVKIWLNRDRLATYNLGVDEVIGAIKSQHLEVPGGKVESPDKEFVVRTEGEFLSEAAFNELIIAYREGSPIRIKDLGRAEAGREDLNSEVRFYTGKGTKEPDRAVALGIVPRSGANDVAMARLVRAEIEDVKKSFPAGMRFEVASDNTVFVQESIREVQYQLLLGGFMAAVVILLFLQNIRTTIFSSIAIPTSIISTFAAVYAFDFSLNNLTMLALVTATGLVIDDSIIMEENIYRHRFELNKSALTAALDGSREIGFAVVASTLTLAGVFLPVAFMGGIIGRFFQEFALTLAFAVFASMFVALTIEPMLASRFLKPGGEKWQVLRRFESVMHRGTALYRRCLAWFLERRYLVVLIMVAALVLGRVFFLHLGGELVTPEDRSEFHIFVETPLSYSIYKTDEVMRSVEQRVREIPELDNYFVMSGYSERGGAEANKGKVWVNLIPKNERARSQQEIMRETRRLLKDIPDLKAMVSEVSIIGGGDRSEEVQLMVQGPSLEGLDRYSQEIVRRLALIPGVVDVDRSLELEKPEVRVIIDRNKAADLGVEVKTIADAVGALIGGVTVVDFKERGESYDVRLRLTDKERNLPTDLDRIWIHTRKGETVELSSIATLQTGVGPNSVNRRDRQHAVSIFANVEGTTMGEVQGAIDQTIAEVLPEGYRSAYIARAEVAQETGPYVRFAFYLAVLLTYLVLAAQFESFIYPFSIMMGLPLTFVGAFGFLAMTGNSYNIYSMLAMVLLVGLPTKNGILLIDRANQMRRQGMALKEALLEAAGTRLRPILMTAASTMAGVIPVALGIGVGSESRQPMAIAIAGGMFSATVLTLIVVPIIYSYLDGFTRLGLFGKIKKRLWVEENGETEGTSL